MKVLIADDAPDIAKMVAFGARMACPGCQVTIAGDGMEALERFGEEGADLVILDVSMPPPNGFEVCQRIRETSQVPILMLTVREDIVDKVRAFDSGADDYLTKPYDQLELVARLRALLRRGAPRRPAVLSAGDLSLDPASRRVTRGDVEVELTAREFSLLEYLLRRQGEVVSKTELLAHVWDAHLDTDLNLVEVYVGYLRRKLDAPFGRSSLQTVRGAGYRLVAEG